MGTDPTVDCTDAANETIEEKGSEEEAQGEDDETGNAEQGTQETGGECPREWVETLKGVKAKGKVRGTAWRNEGGVAEVQENMGRACLRDT